MWFKGKSDNAGKPATEGHAAVPTARNGAAPDTPAAAPTAPTGAAIQSDSQGQPPPPDLPPEEARARAMNAKLVAASFGEIVTLLMRAPGYRGHTIQDLEWLLAPAIMTGQFAIVEAQAKTTGVVSPVGAVLWAQVSPEIDARLSTNLDQPIRLQTAEWRSGQIPWIILTLGEQNVIGGILRQLATTVFKGEPARVRARGEDGRIAVGRIAAEPPPAPATAI